MRPRLLSLLVTQGVAGNSHAQRPRRCGRALCLMIALSTAVALLTSQTAALAFPSVLLEAGRIRTQIEIADGGGMTSLRQLPLDRELLAATARQGVFRITLAGPEGEAITLTSEDAHRCEASRVDGAWQIVWSEVGRRDLAAHVTMLDQVDGAGISLQFEVDNRTDLDILTVEFPVLTCRLPLAESDPAEAVVFPRHEGMLLREPHKYLTPVGAHERIGYPGHAGFQFMGYYDGNGGLYMAAHDAAGYPKEFVVRRVETGLELSIVHLGALPKGTRWSRPYAMAIDTFSGDWMEAADLYRLWSRRQSWCVQRISERDVPEWMRQGVGVFRYEAGPDPSTYEDGRSQDPTVLPPFFPPSKAAQRLEQLTEEMNVPLLITPVGWEKNGSWIGPDYFPPTGGTEAYRDLIRMLHDRDARILLFLSGFRWGLAKPGTGFDGTAAFEREGRSLAIRKPTQEFVYTPASWARNALLCAGCEPARELLRECFRGAFALGADGVQLDQDLGGAAVVCYATDHGHAPGPGRWQSEVMRHFFTEARRAARQAGPDRIITVEEPCELYIPFLDAYHGRAFTYDQWPVKGRGSVSAPVFIYLYHPYILGYAGWAAFGHDPPDGVTASIGRSFIYGMLPGVGSVVWTKAREQDDAAVALDMWRRAIQVQRRCHRALLLGDMTRPPQLRGVRTRVLDRGSWRGGSRPPLSIDAVQATAWASPDEEIWFALVNVESESTEIEVRLPSAGSRTERLDVIRIGPVGESVLARSRKHGEWLPLRLQPYDLLCLRMEPVPEHAQDSQ